MQTTTTSARNAREEARSLLGGDFDARVLEPSPPAVVDEPYLADDPVAAGHTGRDQLLMPAGVGGEGPDWDRWLSHHPEMAAWVAERWLGGERSLPAVPASLASTRDSLHRLATYVIAPARHRATGKFGLRWTLGGFGTPFFGADRQIRVVGTRLVDQRGDAAASAPITSLGAAARFLAVAIDESTAAEHDTLPPGDVEACLDLDVEAVSFLTSWFGMAFAALEQLRADVASIDATRPQLWPGHFDPAIEVGDDDTRASYGASPGDSSIAEPYLYVSVWWPDRARVPSRDQRTPDEIWNARAFSGRTLKVSDFPVGVDPVDVAAGFWRETRDLISQGAEGG